MAVEWTVTWKPIDLPPKEKKKDEFLFTDGRGVYQGYFSGDEIYSYRDLELPDIIAWAFLPDPPRVLKKKCTRCNGTGNMDILA